MADGWGWGGGRKTDDERPMTCFCALLMFESPQTNTVSFIQDKGFTPLCIYLGYLNM